MFAAGGKSPWWLSGLSAFMTTFSAGTFVVWGGIAYQSGLVSVSILMVIGVAALIAGWLFAGVWKSIGYDSASAFIHDRFGEDLVRLYTVLQGLIGLFTMGGAVYALALVVTTLIPLPDGHLLQDPSSGNFSVVIASLMLCLLVVLITFGGGLWAVLMTDALQFVILCISVVLVVPLLVQKVGGVDELLLQLPDGHMSFTGGGFSSYFLLGWMIVFLFKIGGEWAYVQRFVCVPTVKDARKSTFLFGALYLLSPIIWMLPPLIYRVIDAEADYEQAYILACKAVLPSGMLGLMVAAMCSATASMATTQLNVFAGAFTNEFYKRIWRPQAEERELVLAGRLITLILGLVITAGALAIPYLGTYTGYILSSVAILTGPLVLPTIWGLYSKRIGLKYAWNVSVWSLVIGVILKVLILNNGLENFGTLGLDLSIWILANKGVEDVIIGTVIPLVLLVYLEISSKNIDPGWIKVKEKAKNQVTEIENPSKLPAIICAWAVLGSGIMLFLIGLVDVSEGARVLILISGIFLCFLGGGMIMMFKKQPAIEKIKESQNRA
ncbi:sodium-solute symporter, putative [Indibacter alkaliphilus LW1]|uniref:Sodium-solute symporter, putative n=2 Tax=Indibacter TaxID=647744 RepID=S2D7X9_INDAL|nr:sodium-solute symporter, putative [Indibacter alkaliphilus LW1]